MGTGAIEGFVAALAREAMERTGLRLVATGRGAASVFATYCGCATPCTPSESK
jgi:8-oxo-dGTP pyrophosphatase MutT (NUDIX family)